MFYKSFKQGGFIFNIQISLNWIILKEIIQLKIRDSLSIEQSKFMELFVRKLEENKENFNLMVFV